MVFSQPCDAFLIFSGHRAEVIVVDFQAERRIYDHKIDCYRFRWNLFG